jgi:hypothetical protein
MKKTINNSIKIFIFSFVFLSDFIMFSQTPGDDTGDGTLEGDDAPVAPINSKLIVLALAGIIFAVYTFRNNRKRA